MDKNPGLGLRKPAELKFNDFYKFDSRNRAVSNYAIVVQFVVTLERIMCKNIETTPFDISYTDVVQYLKRYDKQTENDKT